MVDPIDQTGYYPPQEPVTVTGTGLDQVTQVTVCDGVPAEITSVSATELTFTVPDSDEVRSGTVCDVVFSTADASCSATTPIPIGPL